MVSNNELTPQEGAELSRMVGSNNEYVNAAYEIYEADGDYEELKDTLIRCAKLEVCWNE